MKKNQKTLAIILGSIVGAILIFIMIVGIFFVTLGYFIKAGERRAEQAITTAYTKLKMPTGFTLVDQYCTNAEFEPTCGYQYEVNKPLFEAMKLQNDSLKAQDFTISRLDGVTRSFEATGPHLDQLQLRINFYQADPASVTTMNVTAIMRELREGVE